MEKSVKEGEPKKKGGGGGRNNGERSSRTALERRPERFGHHSEETDERGSRRGVC